MPLKKVKDNPNLFRDAHSNAIVNRDVRGYQDYIANRDRMKSQEQAMLNNSKEIENLKKDVSEIKDLLQVIANRLQETK
jgi:hypothetical protein